MCEIFSIIGGSVLASLGMTGVGAAATTATGIAATAATVGSLASTGLGIANSIRSANADSARNRAMQNMVNSNNQNTKVTTASEKTAVNLKENVVPKRTLTSLRIPLDKAANSQQLNTTSAGTGLNIPM